MFRFHKNQKYLYSYNYCKDNIISAGTVTANSEKTIIILDGVIFETDVRLLGSYRYEVDSELFFIDSENKELIKSIIQDILEEIKKEGL